MQFVMLQLHYATAVKMADRIAKIFISWRQVMTHGLVPLNIPMYEHFPWLHHSNQILITRASQALIIIV